MNYGYFDDKNKEYVITRPDTPRSWCNYLGSPLYGGIITNNAGGYSFYKSGGTGRLLRLRFNNVPMDQPGRYIYLRDDESSDYWSASWSPVCKPLGRGRFQCRHGLGYTVLEADYGEIHSEATYFIPEGQAFEYWILKLRNDSKKVRRLSAFTYAELANNWNFKQDLENLQYSQYTIRMKREGSLLHWENHLPFPVEECFFGVDGAEPKSFDTDRDAFIGAYRSFQNPLAVEKGACAGTQTVGDNGCASFQVPIELKPGEEREIRFILGVGGRDKARKTLKTFGSSKRVQSELAALRGSWDSRLKTFQVETPDPLLNSLANVWHAYQCHTTFVWSRGVSLVEAGGRDGLGYRDTVQDILGVTHSVPEDARKRLEMMLTGQASTGGAMSLVKPLTHKPGSEKTPDMGHYRSDDHLWLAITTTNYVNETGKLDFLRKKLPYADHGQDTIFGHLIRALDFSLKYRGKNGLAMGLSADWNDCIHFGLTGESVFTTCMLVKALDLTADLARRLGRKKELSWCLKMAAEVKKAIEKKAWDGSWYLHAVSEDGSTLGSRKHKEGSLSLNSQTWAVFSGAASPEKARSSMDAVHDRLASDYGVSLLQPPFTKPMKGFSLSLLVFPPGHKENGGIFCHANSWAIIAETILGRGDIAYEYWKAYSPAHYNDRAELRQVEPYVYNQFTHAKNSPRFGQSRNPWLTGTASWTYIALSQYILGIRPAEKGLLVDPCIPASWKGFKVSREFRGKSIEIQVKNPKSLQKGVRELTLNGMKIAGNLIPANKLKAKNQVVAVLG